MNIGLLVISMILAYKLPFELFLFAYAVMGPLHYMTEIGWLHKKNYFTTEKNEFWILIVWGVLFFFGYFINQLKTWEFSAEFMRGFVGSPMEPVINFLPSWTNNFVFLAFLSALAITILKQRLHKIILIVAGVLACFFVVEGDWRWYIMAFGVFLPTVIHVCIFTGTFMLFGALKSKSNPGYASVILFVLFLATFFFLDLETQPYPASDYIKQTFLESNFQVLSYSIFTVVGDGQFTLDSGLGLNIQRFIAFIYTYHYLNWFSKTSIIQWHNVSRKWMIITGITWVTSVALYTYDYKTGFAALVFLSFLHVFLEFPLNYRSIVGIGQEVSKNFSK